MRKKAIIIGAAVIIIASLIVLGITFYNKKCTPDWECSEWHNCIKSVQARECIDTNECGSFEGRPDVVRSCNMLCFDKIQNQDEEDVDCGGICESCEAKLAPAKNRILIYTILITLCSIFIIIVYRRGKEEAGTLKEDISRRVDNFKFKLGKVKQGIEVREAITDPRLSQVQDYIRRHIASGYSYPAIRYALIHSGWPDYLVDQAYQNVASEYLPKFFSIKKFRRR